LRLSATGQLAGGASDLLLDGSTLIIRIDTPDKQHADVDFDPPRLR
jgi:hypothetical protein